MREKGLNGLISCILGASALRGLQIGWDNCCDSLRFDLDRRAVRRANGGTGFD